MWAQENSGFNQEYQNATSNIETVPEDEQSPFHAKKTISENSTDLKLQDSC